MLCERISKRIHYGLLCYGSAISVVQCIQLVARLLGHGGGPERLLAFLPSAMRSESNAEIVGERAHKHDAKRGF